MKYSVIFIHISCEAIIKNSQEQQLSGMIYDLVYSDRNVTRDETKNIIVLKTHNDCCDFFLTVMIDCFGVKVTKWRRKCEKRCVCVQLLMIYHQLLNHHDVNLLQLEILS